jgi:hypothetical protein
VPGEVVRVRCWRERSGLFDRLVEIGAGGSAELRLEA